MQSEQLKEQVIEALEDMKAQDITVMDVKDKTSITDYMVVASGTSNRHCKAIVDSVTQELSKQDIRPVGTEGSGASSDWVLVDYGDVVVHVMLPETRAFYDLERLWSGAAPGNSQAAQ